MRQHATSLRAAPASFKRWLRCPGRPSARERAADLIAAEARCDKRQAKPHYGLSERRDPYDVLLDELNEPR